MTPIEPVALPPEANPAASRRSTLLLAAVRAFLEIERERADVQDEEMLLAEYSELVLVPALVP